MEEQLSLSERIRVRQEEEVNAFLRDVGLADRDVVAVPEPGILIYDTDRCKKLWHETLRRDCREIAEIYGAEELEAYNDQINGIIDATLFYSSGRSSKISLVEAVDLRGGSAFRSFLDKQDYSPLKPPKTLSEIQDYEMRVVQGAEAILGDIDRYIGKWQHYNAIPTNSDGTWIQTAKREDFYPFAE